MAGLQELRPGPSEDQRRHQEMQRRKLQEDLQEQIRQKREREARAKAEEAAARRKVKAAAWLGCMAMGRTRRQGVRRPGAFAKRKRLGADTC